MEFSFNSDQLMIADTAETFLSAVSDSAAVRRTMATAAGFEEQLWQQITAEMGWQMTHIPEQFDGLGLGYVELCILFERMGQNLLCAPFFSTAALGINALRLAGSDAQQATAFRRIVEQGARYSLAYSGAGRISGVDAVTAQYEMQGAAA
ncbi:MAG: acyl-CoA dehydrogenase family protein, partial [Gammaproteobacteria bacterium]|nr:acyl-CoA dehydrogenase family protein [Gammaproteobacteria bacterium]